MPTPKKLLDKCHKEKESREINELEWDYQEYLDDLEDEICLADLEWNDYDSDEYTDLFDKPAEDSLTEYYKKLWKDCGYL